MKLLECSSEIGGIAILGWDGLHSSDFALTTLLIIQVRDLIDIPETTTHKIDTIAAWLLVETIGVCMVQLTTYFFHEFSDFHSYFECLFRYQSYCYLPNSCYDYCLWHCSCACSIVYWTHFNLVYCSALNLPEIIKTLLSNSVSLSSYWFSI